MRVGIVGCGRIVGQYLDTFDRLTSVELVAVADQDPARAEAVAASRPGVRALTVDELLADDQVDVVLNLTVPAAHAEVGMRVVAAGKHLYGEKPLTATTAESVELLEAARAAGVLVGCAPDTVLGTGVQTARKAVDDGLDRRPGVRDRDHDHRGPRALAPGPGLLLRPRRRAAHGHGAVLRDHAGHAARAGASRSSGPGSRTRGERTIATGPRAGEGVPVTTDTTVSAVLVHASGVLSTLVMSFDGVATRAPNIEVHGETGSLVLPDPNYFDGEVRLCPLGQEPDGWTVLPLSAGYEDAGRGFGLADMARTPGGQQHRASGELALHVLEIMESVLDSAATGTSVTPADHRRAARRGAARLDALTAR